MTSLTQNAAAIEAAMGHTGAAGFGLGGGPILGPSDPYRSSGLPSGSHHRPPQTSATTPPSEFHQHRSPFAIHQLLGLGQDEKSPGDPLVSVHRDDFDHRTKDYRSDYHDKLR